MSEVVLQQARDRAREGRYREAAELFDEYLATRPGPEPRVLLERGYALLLAGDGEGARRIHRTLHGLLASLAEIPAELERLWTRFCELIERVPRRVVAASMAAALVAGCGGQSGEPASKGGTPAGTGQAASTSEPATPSAPLATQPTSTFSDPLGQPLQADDPGFSAHRYSGGVALDLDQLQLDEPQVEPGFSAHRYSGGVALDLDDQLRPEPPTSPSASDLDQLQQQIEDQADDAGYSAHRYSGGVRLPTRRE